MISDQLKQTKFKPYYNQDFFDDMLGIFTGMSRGEAGKYMYDNPSSKQHSNLWEEIVTQNTDYYVPQADSELLQLANVEFPKLIPSGTPYIDFGVGGIESFHRYALPTMKLLNTNTYIGVDFDEKILQQLESSKALPDIQINTSRMDFFMPARQAIAEISALGVMNGITLTNMYGALEEKDLGGNLSGSLKNLAILAKGGWLLLSIDTNQNVDTLMKMYLTPLNSQLNIASLSRAQAQLPLVGFNASLFEYAPRWIPEQQLVAHLAIATKRQAFTMGDYSIDIEKGQELHLFNSYKFEQAFFENSCTLAGLNVLQSWKHKTGVMLYLLDCSNYSPTNGR